MATSGLASPWSLHYGGDGSIGAVAKNRPSWWTDRPDWGVPPVPPLKKNAIRC